MRILLALALVLACAPQARAATTCSADCAQTACTVDCSEADVRDAVKKANDCVGDSAWRGRTISVAAGDPPCTIAMVNDVTMANRYPNSSCADPERYAVCLRNEKIRFVGNGAHFIYAGNALCGQCADECPGPQPALFTLKGTGNTIENLSFRYFPEGIHIRTGADHRVVDVTSDRICEDAITVDRGAGEGQLIRGVTLIGNQRPDAGRTCVLANGEPGACGTDKAIQLNGGGATIDASRIDTISQPVHAAGGEHSVTNTRTLGSATDQNICQSYTAAVTAVGSSTLRLVGNTIEHCKFAVRVDPGALVVATDNTVKDPWVSAFDVRGSGRLKAQGNRIKTRRAGFTSVSSVQRGLVVARNDSSARIDLGGGDFTGLSVVDGKPCAAGGECSTGGNRFCSGGGGSQIDIWNVTDCPCLNQLCNGGLGSCTIGGCAPLDDGGRCAGTAGAGASIGARGNCFRSTGGALMDVKDAGPSSTATDGATECAASDCDF